MLKVIETFSGIGSQVKALKNIQADFEITATSEWDLNAIVAYALIHHGIPDTSKYQGLSDEEIDLRLQSYSLSMDGKEPITPRSLNSINREAKILILASCELNRNLGSITHIHSADIPEDVDVFTYSFPCQDLSLCGCWTGNKTGIDRAAQNRSGMLWEVERILEEMHQENKLLPKFLLMENVTNILSKSQEKHFREWLDFLKFLGYENQIYRLNARNFGIPQNRERAYMISVRCQGDHKKIDILQNYLLLHDLQRDSMNGYHALSQRSLKDILKLDYSDPRYLREAEESQPNDTPSRTRILETNDILFDGKKINDIVVNTITTKQDRHPNSGLILMNSPIQGKAHYRNLTPRECFLLMGFDEKDYQALADYNPSLNTRRKFFTRDKLVKMAGNSIVVDVLEEIFKQIIDLKELLFAEERPENQDVILLPEVQATAISQKHAD